MPFASVHIGLPLQGLARTVPKRQPSPQQTHLWFAQDLDGFRFARDADQGEVLRPWPAVGSFANTPNASPVRLLHNLLWGNGTVDTFRHTATSIHRLLAGSWTSIIGALNLNAPASAYWSSALIPGNTGRGYYLFTSNNNEAGGAPTPQIFFWDGAAPSISNTWTSGTPSPARFVTSFADRAWLAHQLVAGSTWGRRIQWSLPGDGLAWTGTGSGARDFAEFEGPITGIMPFDEYLYILSERAIIRGVESFDVDAPVYFGPPLRNAAGVWAPGSLVRFNQSFAWLSQEGFHAWDPVSNSITNIGEAVDAYIISRIERSAIATICSAFLPSPWNLAIWALPLSSTGLPSEIWAYDTVRQRWLRTSQLFASEAAPIALALITNNAGVTWGALVGAWSAQVGSWASLGGAPTSPLIVSGHNDGETHVLDDTSPNTSIEITIDTPDWTWEGTLLSGPEPRRPEAVIDSRSMITLDGLLIDYSPFDGTAASTLYVLASGDGGLGWTHIGTLTLPAGTLSSVHQAETGFRHTFRSPRLRLTNRHPVTGAVTPLRSTINDITISLRKSGALRFAS